MKQIKVVEIYPNGISNTMVLDDVCESYEYIQYLVQTRRRSQINIIPL